MANVSAGGNRAYNLVDIISILNQDIQNAASPDLIDAAFTIFVPASEVATMRDSSLGGSVTVTVTALPTWGSGSYGLIQWS
jgi:hypothetical protein